MNNFSISQLAQFSGIKPHTIRAWEQRYDALTPDRTEGNTRYYKNEQLRRLLNIVSLKESGYKVSELCSMSDEELFKLVESSHENTAQNEKDEYLVSQLIAAGMSFDELHFDKIFSHSQLRHGMKDTYTKVIYPMLTRIGLMWTSNALPPAQEHFISHMIKKKFFTAIDSLPPAKSASDSWLLFLPENEFHELGLLFALYLIRHSGRKAIYLGSNVPLQTLLEAADDTMPDNLLLFLVHHNLPENIQEYFSRLSTSFSEERIFVAANRKLINQPENVPGIYRLQSVQDLEGYLPPINV